MNCDGDKILKLLVGFACLLMLVPTCVGAEVPQISLSAVESVKNVNILCLGYIDGRPTETARFKRELETQLNLKGFTVSQDPKTCDATLLGSLQVNVRHEDPISALISKAWTTHPSWVYVKLVNANFKMVWEKSYEPHGCLVSHFLPSNRVYSLSDGIINRAIDVARGLAKAKKSK